jgi:hypothetical protein
MGKIRNHYGNEYWSWHQYLIIYIHSNYKIILVLAVFFLTEI